MKNPLSKLSETGFSRKNAASFKSGVFALLLLLIVLSCKRSDEVARTLADNCRLKSEKLTSSTTSTSVRSGGFETTYQVDEQSRLVLEVRKETDADGNPAATKTTQYSYDTNGFLTSIVEDYNYGAGNKYNRKVTQTFQYADGRLIKDEKTGPNEGGSGNYTATQTYEYDAKGELSKKTVKSSGGSGSTDIVTTYTNGRITGIKHSSNTYEVNPQGLITKEITPSGTASHEFNAQGQLVKTEVLNANGSKLYANTYEYANLDFKQTPNPVGFKGFPTVPSGRGKTEPIAKQENFFVNKSGTYDKDDSIVNTYQLDGKGNVVTKTETHTMPGQTATYVRSYEYDGCK